MIRTQSLQTLQPPDWLICSFNGNYLKINYQVSNWIVVRLKQKKDIAFKTIKTVNKNYVYLN